MTYWKDRALCKEDPDLWWDNQRFKETIHQCLVHCPVLFKCREEAFNIRPFGGVMAGIRWTAITNGTFVGRPSRYSGPIPCDQCKAQSERACGYCGEHSSDPSFGDVRKTSHIGCHDDYVKSMAEITMILFMMDQPEVCTL